MRAASHRASNCWLLFVADDGEPSGERYIRMIYDFAAGEALCAAAAMQGVKAWLRPYGEFVRR